MSDRFKGYYDWETTFTKDAPMTLVISERSRGKTYGLRKQAIHDFLKMGALFVEIYRTDAERKDIAPHIFEKIEDDKDFKDYIFRSDSKGGYIAKKPADGEKPKWKQICYHVAMTLWQRDKKKAFKPCKRFIFDEAIIDSMDRFHTYLPNEVTILAQIISTVSRENINNDSKIRPRLYCLGNACDFINSIFMYFGITEVPPFGYSWYANKTLLIHYVEPEEARSVYMETMTTSGRILSASPVSNVNNRNQFIDANDDFIEKKPRAAAFYLGFVFKDQKFGLWVDRSEGLIYVNDKIVKNSPYVYALTTKDNRINLMTAKKSARIFKDVVELYYNGSIRYENITIRESFYTLMKLFGVS